MYKISVFTVLWAILSLLPLSPIMAQECGNDYNCWKNKGDENFNGKLYDYAIDCYRAAQVCDDAPEKNKLDSLIESAQKAQINFEREKTKALEKANEKNDLRKKADDVVSKYNQVKVKGDMTLALLELHNQCRQTNNSHPLAVKARCELVSDSNNLFYRQQLNLATYFNNESLIKFSIQTDFSLMFAGFTNEYEPFDAQLILFDKNGTPLPTALNLSPQNMYLDVRMSPNGRFLTLVTQAKTADYTEGGVPQSLSLLATDGKTKEQPINSIKNLILFDVSKTGDTICALENYGKVSLINTQTRLVLNSFHLDLDTLATLNSWRLSPDGKSVMAIYNDSIIRVWTLNSKITFREWSLKNGFIQTAIYAPDSRHIAVGFATGDIWIIDVFEEKNKKGVINQEDKTIGLQGHAALVRALAFSPDSQFLLSGSDDLSVKVWDWQNQTPLRTYFGHNFPIISVGFSSDKRQFFSMGEDNKVNFWDFKVQYVPFIQNGNLAAQTVSPDANLIFQSYYPTSSISSDTTIINELQRIDGSVFYRFSDVNKGVLVRQSWFSSDNRYFVLYHTNGTIEIWNITAPQVEKVVSWTLQKGNITVTFSPKNSLVWIRKQDGSGFVYDFLAKKETTTPPLSNTIQFSPNDKYWIIEKNDEKGVGIARLFNNEGKSMTLGQLESIKFSKMAFLADNKYLVATAQNTLYLYDLDKDSVQTLPANFSQTEIYFTIKAAPVPYEKYFFIKGSQNAQIWHLDSLERARFKFEGDTISICEFHPQGDYFLTKNYLRPEWRIRKTNNRSIIATFGPANTVKFAPQHDTNRLYFVANEVRTQKTYLGEVQLKKENNDADMDWRTAEIGFEKTTIIETRFTEELDTIVLKTNFGIYAVPNHIKQLNDGTLIEKLDYQTKKNYGLLTDEDCQNATKAHELVVCISYYAENCRNNPVILKKFKAAIKQFYRILENDEVSSRKNLYTTLAAITPTWEYEKNYQEKYTIENEIVRLIDSLPDNANEGMDSTLRGRHYSNLCWYSLFDTTTTKVERVKKCIEYGKKAVSFSPLDWIQANLGHGYLFSGDIESAQKLSKALLYRSDAIIKDYQVLNDNGVYKITDPNIQAMLTWINKETSKKK